MNQAPHPDPVAVDPSKTLQHYEGMLRELQAEARTTAAVTTAATAAHRFDAGSIACRKRRFQAVNLGILAALCVLAGRVKVKS
jgi:hypothetical protein